MTVITRASVKGYFDNGDTVSAQSFIDLIDSLANLADTTSQSFASEIAAPNFVAPRVSAANITVANLLTASAATFTGRVRQGVSAAASAADTRGDLVVVQEATVASNGTAQIANLPPTSNIVSFKVKVLVGGSAGTGGLNIRMGNADASDYFGTLSVSATGIYEFANVSAPRLTGASGAVQMVAVGASTGTNLIGVVSYYQRA